MWSKTRQALLERLAPSLAGRVDYHYIVYDRRKHGKGRSHDTMDVFEIRVDQVTRFATNPQFYDEFWPKEQKISPDDPQRNEALRKLCDDVIRETGHVYAGYGAETVGVMLFVHEYLNELSLDGALNSENCFVRLLAFLDRRLGKRRLKAFLDGIDGEPEWLRGWLLLRAEAEGLQCAKEAGK